jgi:predicted amidophosphoribosyltransferase
VKSLAWILESLFELVYPERCSLCGAENGKEAWSSCGDRIAGLRFWDGTHLCLACGLSLGGGCVDGRVGTGKASSLPVVAAVPTNPDLVKLVGQFKYHGVRGLAWPLANMLRKPLATARQKWGEVDALVPVALHSRRRRVRGFNQAEILARLLTSGSETPVLSDILVRHRNTGQQAKITSASERRSNLSASFQAFPPVGRGAGHSGCAKRIGLVDDLVTSGWTAASAADTLRAAGWDVRWILALGLAAEAHIPGCPVDTWVGGF